MADLNGSLVGTAVCIKYQLIKVSTLSLVYNSFLQYSNVLILEFCKEKSELASRLSNYTNLQVFVVICD